MEEKLWCTFYESLCLLTCQKLLGISFFFNVLYFNYRDQSLTLKAEPGTHTLEYVVENCGRINYVKSLDDFPKKKGLGPDNQLAFEGAEILGDIKITGLPFTSKWVTR